MVTGPGRSTRDPNWAWQELVLACDLVEKNGWRELAVEFPAVQELSRLLRMLTIHRSEDRGPRFRSPDAVRRKMADIATRHPASTRKSTKGSKLDVSVLEAFRSRPARMRALAGQIRTAAITGRVDYPLDFAEASGINDSATERSDAASAGLEFPTAEAVLRGLQGRTIPTATGLPNTVLKIEGDTVLVRTQRSPSGQSVPIADVQRGLDLLAAHGSVRVSPKELGHRSTFVGAVLATLPGAQFTGKLVTVTIAEPNTTSLPLEVLEALDDADRIAGRPRRSSRGQGFGLTQPERDEIERHSMDLAAKHLTDAGYIVEDVSGNNSYDFAATRADEYVHVEVKGTTSQGEEIILTRKEVELMTKQYPHTMLIVVHNITLDDTSGSPRATGGTVQVEHPWRIQPENLVPISYRYQRNADSARSYR